MHMKTMICMIWYGIAAYIHSSMGWGWGVGEGGVHYEI